jgi:nitroimidazol reductase NimA-like FMN-containing flavoprotein (pyridoxamine 5'-phosphate oxidase superfamily)
MGDLDAVARGILDDNRYMALGTADETGRPWVSPVYYAPDGYRTFYWVSSPERRHSRNVAVRPEVSIVVFDSQVAIGEGQAVYMAGTAGELTGEELERGIETFSRVSQRHGAKAWTIEDVRPPAALRLYQATVSEHWVLDPEKRPDERTPVDP